MKEPIMPEQCKSYRELLKRSIPIKCSNTQRQQVKERAPENLDEPSHVKFFTGNSCCRSVTSFCMARIHLCFGLRLLTRAKDMLQVVAKE